jgi:hypothetical protein
MQVGAGEACRSASFFHSPRAQRVLGLGHAARRGHQQREAEVGGGFGQHVGRVGDQHAGGAGGITSMLL